MVRNNTGNGEEGQITRALAEFSANLEYEDLSPEVVDWAKYLCFGVNPVWTIPIVQ